MRDYGLEGHYLAKEEFNPFCQSIKHNCCNKEDYELIYEKYNSGYKPAIHAYRKNMKRQIKNLSI